MDRETLQAFIWAAETELSSVRSSLLIFAQSGDRSDLATARRSLALFRSGASEIGQTGLVTLATRCEDALDIHARADGPPADVYSVLDDVARTEAALLSIPMHADDFLPDVAGFVDASFEGLMPQGDSKPDEEEPPEEFEIDEETLDIFRDEAEELLGNIADNLRALTETPGDQNALWEIRRNAHTFKGAAGIVGLKDAAAIAHRMEDLLDKMVEINREAVPQVIDFLDISAGRLNAIVNARNTDDDGEALGQSYDRIMAWLGSDSDAKIADAQSSTNGTAPGVKDAAARIDPVRTAPVPIVRVSLDRLDELIQVSRSLLRNRSDLAKRLGQFVDMSAGGAAHDLESMLETGRLLTDEMLAKLMQIRMVKFGTLETRLSRAVNVTCQDDNKKASVELINGDIEIDTQIMDALIEPLLHLLKNAVIHGIESPDTRRLIGKPEMGTIRISLETDHTALVLAVSDDGGGISVPKLKEKAMAAGILDADTAASMTDRAAFKLIFDRGLTTADKIDLNAGRGVGMSIVKESVESRGGTVLIESEPRRGTTFTIVMPLAIAATEIPVVAEIPVAAEIHVAAEVPAAAAIPVATAIPVVTAIPAAAPPPAADYEGSTPLILIVDDSASMRRHMTNLVEKAGLRPVTANNGAEALELLLSGSFSPDLILSDVEMPQIDGWGFLEYVKTNDNVGHIPVVLVTSLDTDSFRERAFGLGASGYVVKPFRQNDLDRILKEIAITALT